MIDLHNSAKCEKNFAIQSRMGKEITNQIWITSYIKRLKLTTRIILYMKQLNVEKLHIA